VQTCQQAGEEKEKHKVNEFPAMALGAN